MPGYKPLFPVKFSCCSILIIKAIFVLAGLFFLHRTFTRRTVM